MASFFNLRSWNTRSNKTNNQQKLANSPTTPTGQLLSPSLPALLNSPSLASGAAPEATVTEDREPSAMANRRSPYFFREENAGLVVKGNLVTLAAQPEFVDKAEWLAHQVVEQWRILTAMLNIIQEVDPKTQMPICNPQTCPTMSAGGHTYTWLDQRGNPTRIPASHYIALIQRWILGKINDPNTFPTEPVTMHSSSYVTTGSSASGASTPIAAGPTNLNAPLSALAGREWLGKASGFSETFENDIKALYRQMFRCYAHIYYSHWVEPFYHVSATSQLNTCFIHFVNVGRFFDLLSDKEITPMQPLLDIWIARGLLPSKRPEAAIST